MSTILADAREALKRAEQASVEAETGSASLPAETRALRDCLQAVLDWAEAADRRLADVGAIVDHAHWLR